jgi:hypothetical protein
MAESRGVKYWLDWIQHGYWIGNAIVSLGIGRAVMTWLAKHVSISPDWRGVIWLLFSGVTFWVFAFIGQRWKGKHSHGVLVPAPELQTVPTTAIGGATAAVDVRAALARMYNSTLQLEVEANFNAGLQALPQAERESMAVRLLSSGLIAYMYDRTWWYMFKSQLLMLHQLNTAALRMEDVKQYYDRAVEEKPGAYTNYTFQQWIQFMRDNVLVLDLAGNSLGITVRGKDFLKHIAHWGYDINGKVL